jgi:hypothetical protein
MTTYSTWAVSSFRVFGLTIEFSHRTDAFGLRFVMTTTLKERA